jgi:Uma2 family endonuclease
MTQIITDISQLDPNGTYTYADYLTWKFSEMVELIKGKMMRMSAPVTQHQRISWRITTLFAFYFNNKSCEVFTAPFDVRLKDSKKAAKANKDILTTVQPDLCVICDVTKIDRRGCIGSPDLVVEILSEGNSKKEMRIKYDLYEENEILEYWIVDPEHETLHQFVLDETTKKYQGAKIYVNDDAFSSSVFADMEIDLTKIFVTYENDTQNT